MEDRVVLVIYRLPIDKKNRKPTGYGFGFVLKPSSSPFFNKIVLIRRRNLRQGQRWKKLRENMRVECRLEELENGKTKLEARDIVILGYP